MNKIIYLNHGAKTIVDSDDYKRLIPFKWRLNTTGYATRTYRSISMSRVIMNAKTGEYVDHINGNKLDNRKSNLRICSNQQNSWNKVEPTKSISGAKGVRQRDKKWQSYSNDLNGKQVNLGRYNTKLEAMKAYDNYIKKTRGLYGVTNKMLGNY